jgi:hypothetical protein
MDPVRRRRAAVWAAGFLAAAASARPAEVAKHEVRLFQSREQALMDAIGTGDKAVWDRAMDPSCVVTSEEGEVLTKAQFLEELRPLPPGLGGSITVKDVTVIEYPGFAVVRALGDEQETVFGQKLAVQYRTTGTWRRAGTDWKLVALHLSVVTEDPPRIQVSDADWPAFAGTYRLLPDGWTLTVERREGKLYAGRDPRALRELLPIAPNVFVQSGRLGEWIFVLENGKAARVVNFRKFEPLVWSRVDGEADVPTPVLK